MKEPTIIIDYGMGNLGSIANMIKYLGYKSVISSDLKEIELAERIILPGVGHFDKAMNNINALGLNEIIKKKALVDKTPLLGICLGMQIMCNESEEGNTNGLSLVDAKVNKFRFEEQNLKIPHMGWNRVYPRKKNLLLDEEMEELRFYFVHSYFVSCNQADDILCTTHYGHEFVSAFQQNNICGVQFHPEKSHKFGMMMLKNFIEKV